MAGPERHKIFRGYPQSIGQAIDVIKESGYLDNIMNILIAVAVTPQALDILLRRLVRRERQIFGQSQGCQGMFRQSGSPPIFGKSVNQSLIIDLCPEVMQMDLNSVVTMIGLGNNYGYHLSLWPAQ